MSGIETAAENQDRTDRWLSTLEVELPGVDLEVEAMVNRIQSLSKRLRTSMDETLAEHGLSGAEFQVLCGLKWQGPPHRNTPGRLAKSSDLSSGAMTNRLDGLERRGLIRRLPDPDDRRGVLVELTDEGDAAWETALGAQGAKEALIASALDDDEKDQLNSLLRRLMLAFEQRSD